MPDPIQASSAMPLPSYQTLQGTRDPLPLSSPAELRKSADSRTGTDEARAADAFKDYLDRTSITTVERQQRKPEADAVDMFLQNSAYGQAGVTTPI